MGLGWASPAALGGWRLERRDPDRVCFGHIRPELIIMIGGNHSPFSVCFHAALSFAHLHGCAR